MTTTPAHTEVDAAADHGVRNSQPQGIGRVVALGDLVGWNNLGRNVVFADHSFRASAVFGSTDFPGQDEPSQYDLDVHEILDVPELDTVVVLNHFGTVRGFRRGELTAGSRALSRVEPLVEPYVQWSFVADVERTVVVGDRLVGSGPRHEGGIGLLVSAGLGTFPDGGRLPTRACGPAVGEVTALGVVGSDRDALLAIGGDGSLRVAPMTDGRLGPPRWEIGVEFRVATLAWHGGALWAAGPDRTENVDDYDWERLAGGGFVAIDPSDGSVIVSGPLPDDVAWGTGGVAVAPIGRHLVAADRKGRLHVIDPWGRTPVGVTSVLRAQSLGIAHVAVVGQRVLAGYNRGGYRLHAFGPL